MKIKLTKGIALIVGVLLVFFLISLVSALPYIQTVDSSVNIKGLCGIGCGGSPNTGNFYFPRFENGSYYHNYNITTFVSSGNANCRYTDFSIFFNVDRNGSYYIYLPKKASNNPRIINLSIDNGSFYYMNWSYYTEDTLAPITNGSVNLTEGIHEISLRHFDFSCNFNKDDNNNLWKHVFFYDRLILVQEINDTLPPVINSVDFKQNYFLHNETPLIIVNTSDSESEIKEVNLTYFSKNGTISKNGNNKKFGTYDFVLDLLEPTEHFFYFNISDYFNNTFNSTVYNFTILNNSPEAIGYFIPNIVYAYKHLNATAYPGFSGYVFIGDSSKKRIIENVSVKIKNSTNSFDYSFGIEVKEYPIGIYLFFYNINLTEVPMSFGRYYEVVANITDKYGNFREYIIPLRFLVQPLANRTFDIVLNKSLMYDAIAKDFGIDIAPIKLKTDVTDQTLSLAYYNVSVYNVTEYGMFNRYYTIETSLEIKKNLEWAVLKLYYNDSKVVGNENLLRLAKFNETLNEWEICDSNGGVDVEKNFVWCNTTSFSEWSVVQIPEPEPESPSPPPSTGGVTGRFYIPIKKVNETKNDTLTIIREELDCENISLPQNWVCNSTGVYGEPIVETKEIEKIVTKEVVPGWAYAFLVIGLFGIVLSIYTLSETRKKK